MNQLSHKLLRRSFSPNLLRRIKSQKLHQLPQCNYILKLSTRSLSTTTADREKDEPTVVSDSAPFLSKEASLAPIDFDVKDRWKVVIPASLVHLSIGSVYVYSMWTPGIISALGVVGSAPLDWTHSQVLPVFSSSAVVLGFTTGLFGSWVEKSGPRKAGLVGSLFWSSALCTTGLGVHLHSLPLVYLGYGVLGGIGWGLMYLAPVTTVMKFFPDRRGLATGISLSAFGAGAALAPSMIDFALDFFFIAPDFIGTTAAMANIEGNAVEECVKLQTLSDGSQIIAESSPVGNPGQEIIVATESDLARLSNISTGPGVYDLNTGDTGTAKALASMGIFYGLLGSFGATNMRIPHPDWKPNTASKVDTETEGKDQSKEEDINYGLPASYVTTNTIQFPLLWLSVFGNATGGLALLSSSKLMLVDIWAGIAPDIVTSSFSTGYVSSLGIGMAAGRFGWSALSDKLGRQNTYALFGVGIPLCSLAPTLCHAAVDAATSGESTASVYPMLMGFYGGSVLAITFYGGIFSVLPAYIADLFGQKYAGAIHGKALTAWAASAVVGPMGLATLRSHSVSNATQDLIEAVEDKDAFLETFGCQIDDSAAIEKLIDAKTLTIARMMELVPVGTADPTPFLYDTTLYIAAGLMSVSALANLAIRPLDVKQKLKEL